MSTLASVFADPVYGKVIISVIIIIVAFGIVKLIHFFIRRWHKTIVSASEDLTKESASQVETRFDMLCRIVYVIIYFIAIVIILFQIPAVRSVATTLLATAGVMGIIAGLAAQTTLSNLIAGISIAFSQPVRLGDAVIYNDDWGWIEEITLMHTVIRTWDNRRLIVPNSMLNNTVLQNWTIKDEWLLGVVMIYVDYLCDVEQVRTWAKEIIEASTYSTPEKVAVLQVVDFTEKTMVLRILGKSWDASNTWNLRCEIREKLIKKFHQAGLPLPEIRIADVNKSVFSNANPSRAL